MRKTLIHLRATWLVLGATSIPALAQVYTSEFFSDPVSEGWELALQFCEPEVWIDDGWYHQQLDLDACPPGPGGGA